MQSLWHILLNHLPFILLASALLVERAFPIPAHIHPFVALRQMALRLAKRVHPSLQRARSQQRISGLLALLLLLLLWVCIPALLYALAELKQGFAALILGLCLFSQPWLRHAEQVQRAVNQQQKQLARARLQPWLNRDCLQLSSLGIEKAASEHTALRIVQGWWGVLFWFVLAGPLAALAYRVVFELRYAWSVDYDHWRDFGAASSGLFLLLNGLPHALARIIFLLLNFVMRTHPTQPNALLANPFCAQQNNQLFAILTSILPLSLGGPVKYQGVRYARTRYMHPQAPKQHLIQHSIRYLTFLQCLLFLLILPVFLLLWY